jgi:protein-S-isoprenylcysteine O-methyltransferase Ste14
MGLHRQLVNLYYRAATSSRNVRTLLTPIGACFFFLLIWVFISLSLLIDDKLSLPRLFPHPWNIAVSLPVLTIGLVLALWSVFHFARVRGTPVPFNPPPRLVVTGPYAHARNPMLTGIFMILFGLGILLKSISLTFFLTPLFILLNLLELKAIEEPELEKRLGDEYRQYKKRVPMFVPGWKTGAKHPVR